MSSVRRSSTLHASLSALCALNLCACTQAEPKPPPAPPPDRAVSAKELNSLAAPVIPKPGSGIKLKSLTKPADSAAQVAPAPSPTATLAPSVPSPRAPSTVATKPGASWLGPLLPHSSAPVAAKSGAPPAAAAKPVPAPAAPVENTNDLVNPLLPGKKVAAKPTLRPGFDRSDLEALSAPDLPPPPAGTKAAIKAPPPAAAAPPPTAAEPAPDPNNTFAAALPSGERGLSSIAGTPAAWLITAKGIGSLRPGARLAGLTGDIGSRYVTTMYADAQPLEGFAFDEPPVLIVVRNGPYAAWGRAHAGEPVPDSIKQRAVELAQAGKLSIHMLVVTAKGPKTERGVSVGDSYASFAKAYPSAGTPAKFPALWEEPTCVITQKTLWFFFDRCDERAKLRRIVVRGRR